MWLLRILFVKQTLETTVIVRIGFLIRSSEHIFLWKKANSSCRCKCYLHWFIYFLFSPLDCLHLCQFLAVGSSVLPQAFLNLNKFLKMLPFSLKMTMFFQTWPFWVKENIAQHVTAIIFVSAGDKSHDSWANSQKLTQM